MLKGSVSKVRLCAGLEAGGPVRCRPGALLRRALQGQGDGVVEVEAGAVVAPAPAVQSGQKGDYVFVVKEDLTVEQRPVTVSRTVEQKAVVSQGLAPGERVVTDGQLRLAPGALVQVKEAGGSGEEAGGPGEEAGA